MGKAELPATDAVNQGRSILSVRNLQGRFDADVNLSVCQVII
jgi:hypothetical protein